MPRPHDPAIDDAVLRVLQSADKPLLFAEICRQAKCTSWEARMVIQNLELAGSISKRKGIFRGHPWLYEYNREQHRPDRWSAAGLVEAWG